MSSISVAGDTSGSVTLQAPAVAGSTVLTLPTTSGTLLYQNPSAPANSLVIDASGNVGIGTSSPSNKLDVVGDNTFIAQRASTTAQSSGGVWAMASTFWSTPTYTGTGIQQFGSTASGTTAGLTNASLGLLTFQNGSAGLIYTNGATPIVFGTTNAERIRITSTGGVSFGATGTAYGTSGQVLTSAGNAPPTWATPGASGASITDDNATNTNQYIGMTRITTGSWTTAYVASTYLYFNPSSGTLYSVVFQSLSDKNKKTNINNIENALDIVENINGVTFDWKESGLPSAGLIAQDVEKYLPELISDSEGTKSLNYNGVIGVLVEAIKELSEKIKVLESK